MSKPRTRSSLFMSPAELALLDRAAASLRVSRHKFMVDAATERANAALAAQVSPSPCYRDVQENQVLFAHPNAMDSAI